MLYPLMDHANIAGHIVLDAIHVKFIILKFSALHVLVVIIIQKDIVHLAKIPLEYAKLAINLPLIGIAKLVLQL